MSSRFRYGGPSSHQGPSVFVRTRLKEIDYLQRGFERSGPFRRSSEPLVSDRHHWQTSVFQAPVARMRLHNSLYLWAPPPLGHSLTCFLCPVRPVLGLRLASARWCVAPDGF